MSRLQNVRVSKCLSVKMSKCQNVRVSQMGRLQNVGCRNVGEPAGPGAQAGAQAHRQVRALQVGQLLSSVWIIRE